MDKYKLIVLAFCLTSCLSEKQRIGDKWRDTFEMKKNEVTEVVNYISHNTDTINEVYINTSGVVELRIKAEYVRMDKLDKVINRDELDKCILNLKSLSLVGISRGVDFVKLTRDNSFFDSECYHIEVLDKREEVENENKIKVGDNTYVLFESCLGGMD